MYRYCPNDGTARLPEARYCIACGYDFGLAAADTTPAPGPALAPGAGVAHPAWRIGVPLIAAAGGLLGVLGALLSEVLSGDVFLPFVAAPVAEEIMKPIGVILLMYTRPRLLGGRMQVATLCMMGGVVFGYVESVAYVNIYADRPTDGYILFRYTVTPAMHAFTSFVFGLGLNQKLIGWANGTARFRETDWPWFLAAMLLHSAYNITVTVLDATDTFRFEEES